MEAVGWYASVSAGYAYCYDCGGIGAWAAYDKYGEI